MKEKKKGEIKSTIQLSLSFLILHFSAMSKHHQIRGLLQWRTWSENECLCPSLSLNKSHASTVIGPCFPRSLRDEVWLEKRREGISMAYLLYYNYKKRLKGHIRRGRQTSQSIIIPFIPPHFDLKYLFYNYANNLVVIWEFKIKGHVSLCFNNMLFKKFIFYFSFSLVYGLKKEWLKLHFLYFWLFYILLLKINLKR